MKTHLLNICLAAAALSIMASCNKGPLEEIGYKSNERAIEVFRVPGQVGEAEIIRTADQAEVNIMVLEDDIDLSNVVPEIMVSIGATVSPASGEPVDFAANGNVMKYTVTSESGLTREWTVRIEPFEIPSWIGKTWKLSQPGASGGSLQSYTVTGDMAETYPGQNPLGALTDHLDTKGYMFFLKTTDGVYKYTRPMSFFKFANYIPSIMDEYDNTLTFTFTGLNDDATAVLGNVEFSAGPDGKYAQFPTITYNGETPAVLDFEKLFRHIPEGKSTFSFDLATSVLTLYDAEGNEYSATSTRGTIIDNGSSTVTIDKAFSYDEAAGTLQLRYQPENQALPGAESVYNNISSYTFDIPWVNLNTNSATGTGVYQMSGAAEVWYDFVLAE